MPANGEKIYARLYTYFGTFVVSADYTYTAVTQSAVATPTPVGTYTSSDVTFDWTVPTSATKYALHLGSTGAGADNLYDSGGVTVNTLTRYGLPTNGETIYARLHTYFGTVVVRELHLRARVAPAGVKRRSAGLAGPGVESVGLGVLADACRLKRF
jgi:hypothetical protein